MIGSYVVTIRSEIEVPNDASSGTTTIMFDEYTFTIFIEPCIVNSYSATQEVVDLTYNIGAPEMLNVGPYVFDEDPVCNYPETVTLTDLPVFVTHNAPTTDDFSIPQTADLALIGSYPVTIRSEICVPDDHTLATCTPFEVDYDFKVVM